MIRTLRTILNVSLLVIFLLGCSAQSGMAKRRPPKWVNERPVTSEYYIGIAVASKDAADYMKIAKNQALQDLCSEISVHISANSVLQQFENNIEFKEEFQANVRTSLIQSIEGYEIAGSWDNKRGNQYWVYYRLSKSKYELQKRLRLNKAKKVAQTYFEQAKESEKQLDIYSALNYYAKSIDAIKNHLDEDLSVMTFNGNVNLGTDIYNSIQDIYKRTEIIPSTKAIKIDISSSLSDPLLFKAIWHGNNGTKTLSNLPLKVRFTKGEGVITDQIKTDNSGYASSQLVKVTSRQKLQEIQARIDLNGILEKENENHELNAMFFTVGSAPKGKIILNVDRLKAYLNFSEKIFGKNSKRQILKNNLKKELSDSFFSFTNSKDQAKVILDIKTNVTKGEIKEGRNYKVYIVYLDCFFSLTDAKSGMEIFNEAIYEVKGMKPISYDYAVREAYENAVDEIHNTIIPKLNQLDL
jgi:hypothetical protein